MSRADEFLIEQIRQGSQDGWARLVQRYHGRLLAFARSHLRDRSLADDVVQETFLGFLKSVDRFRTRASLETYLFTILRRRLVDTFRRQGRRDEITLCSLRDYHGEANEDADAIYQPAASDPSASMRLQRSEQREQLEDVLWTALQQTIERLQQEMRFRDLQIIEMIFYAQLRNKEIANLLEIDEKQVALVKHRLIKGLAQQVAGPAAGEEAELADESMLTRLWEQHRPSCPKRSTVGKWLLGTLEASWSDYVAFHVDTLGCRFCRANVEDLRPDAEPAEGHRLRDRILQSSVGFFRAGE